ncbi:hypothetical protein J2X29_001035 [Shewanella putrefaciens]|nr:hypothetical protein [Shewanella putrefaciens]
MELSFYIGLFFSIRYTKPTQREGLSSVLSSTGTSKSTNKGIFE